MAGFTKALELNTDTVMWGGVQTAVGYNINVSLVSETSALVDLPPSFSIKPFFYCVNPFNLTPLSYGFYSIGSSAGLLESLLLISTTVANDPAEVAGALTVLPPLIVLEQDTSAADVVQLAHQGNGSVGLGVPLMVMGPAYPVHLAVPTPAHVSLDLSGCVGCVSLLGRSSQLYLTNLNLTGLERGPGVGNGAQLSLPLWAFQFDRTGNTSVHLFNVTLILPQDEFGLLLAGLSVGPGPATAPQSLPPGLTLQVRGVGKGWGSHFPRQSSAGLQWPGGGACPMLMPAPWSLVPGVECLPHACPLVPGAWSECLPHACPLVPGAWSECLPHACPPVPGAWSECLSHACPLVPGA